MDSLFIYKLLCLVVLKIPGIEKKSKSPRAEMCGFHQTLMIYDLVLNMEAPEKVFLTIFSK